MSSGFLLDTNIVIGLFGGDPAVSEKVEGATYLAISVVVYAELLAGSLRSSRIKENVDRLERFVRQVPLLDCDRYTAKHFSAIAVRLRRKGRPIPENDLWIAATAQQHGLTVVSRDRHFAEVEEVDSISW